MMTLSDKTQFPYSEDETYGKTTAVRKQISSNCLTCIVGHFTDGNE